MQKYAVLFLVPFLMAATPLMNLDLPTPGVTTGPQWAQKINTALTTIDSHNHTTGQGAKVPSAGLNINADLSFGAFSPTNVGSAKFTNQGGTLSSSNTNAAYVVSGNLYFNNASGTPVKITDGSGLNIASLGTIGGDYGGSNPASVFYTDATKTFSFTQSSGVTAKMAFGDFTVFETTSGAAGITVKSPSSLASSYTLTLPPSLPASNRLVAVSATGALTAGATNAVQTGDITNGAVTRPKLAPLGEQISSETTYSKTSTSFALEDVAGLTVTITTTGRPVFVGLVPQNPTSASYVRLDTNTVSSVLDVNMLLNLFFVRNTSTTIGGHQFVTQYASDGSMNRRIQTRWPISVFTIDTGLAAGTYTYKVQVSGSGVGTSNSYVIQNAKLVAYEL